jgi:hypothetical protein
MKTKRTLTIATVLVALAALMTLGILRGTRQVQAQDVPPPPRTSLARGHHPGQTGSTWSTFPTPVPDSQLQTYRVVMTFLDAEGHRLRDQWGELFAGR